MKKKLSLAVISLLILLVVQHLISGPADAKPFYEGKVIKLIVSTNPGGGYDFYGRLVARYMKKYLPGSEIIVKNVPGAGHIIGCNQTYHARPDGLTIGAFSCALPLTQVAGVKGVKFDISKMSWLGSAAEMRSAFMASAKSPFRSLEDLKKADTVRVGAAGVGSLGYVSTMLFAYMADLNNLKISTGYGGGESRLALMRNEIDLADLDESDIDELIKEGAAAPVFFIANKTLSKYPGVPNIREIIKDDKYKPVVNLLLAVHTLGRPFAGPPGIPEDRLKILQDAFTKTCSDPELLKLAERTGRPIEYTSAKEALNLVSSLQQLTPDVVKLVKKSYGLE